MASGLRQFFTRDKNAGTLPDVFSLEAVKSLTLDVFSAPIFIMRNGEIIFANAACCRAFSATSPSDIIGDHITERLSDLQPDCLPWRQSLDVSNETFKAQASCGACGRSSVST